MFHKDGVHLYILPLATSQGVHDHPKRHLPQIIAVDDTYHWGQ